MGLRRSVVRIPEELGGGLRTGAGESVPQVEQRVGMRGPGRGGAGEGGSPAESAACSPCGSRVRLAAALYRLALRTAALGVLPGPRRERVLKPERVPAGRLAGRTGNGGILSFRRL